MVKTFLLIYFAALATSTIAQTTKHQLMECKGLYVSTKTYGFKTIDSGNYHYAGSFTIGAYEISVLNSNNLFVEFGAQYCYTQYKRETNNLSPQKLSTSYLDFKGGGGIKFLNKANYFMTCKTGFEGGYLFNQYYRNGNKQLPVFNRLAIKAMVQADVCIKIKNNVFLNIGGGMRYMLTPIEILNELTQPLPYYVQAGLMLTKWR